LRLNFATTVLHSPANALLFLMSKKEIKAILDSTLPAQQHGRVEVIQGLRKGYDIRSSVQNPLDMYLKRKQISFDQHFAGNKYFIDCRYGNIYCPRGMEMRDSNDGGSPDGGSKQQEAKDRARQARASIYGEIGKRMLDNVCCYGYALAGVDYENHPKGSHKMEKFREVLDDLAKHYKEQLKSPLR